MTEIVVWPHEVLVPGETQANIVPFSRTGGRTLGGLQPATRTDRGWWTITLQNVLLSNQAAFRTWDAISEYLGGQAGYIAVPIWAFETAPYADGGNWRSRPSLVNFSDGTTFSDGSWFRQRRISVRTISEVSIGDTQCTLEVINAEARLSGVRFSYQYAAYKTGRVISQIGNRWTVPITPACRATIPAGADLEFDVPTCLCRLADDRGMDRSLNPAEVVVPSVTFNEAVDFWSNLAAGLIESPFLS